MRKVFLLAVIISVLAVGVQPIFAQAVTAINDSGITVSATGVVRVQPDIAFVTFGVVTEDPTAAEAVRSNAAITTRVINAITQFGIPRTDIETLSYSVEPILDYDSRPPITVGYRVVNRVQVRMTDISRIGELIDVAIAAGANDVQGVRFTVEDETEVQQRALTQAIEKAEAKARLMAQQLGVTLGRVISATETTVGIPGPVVFGAARAEAATPILPGEVDVTANVTVTYSIL